VAAFWHAMSYGMVLKYNRNPPLVEELVSTIPSLGVGNDKSAKQPLKPHALAAPVNDMNKQRSSTSLPSRLSTAGSSSKRSLDDKVGSSMSKKSNRPSSMASLPTSTMNMDMVTPVPVTHHNNDDDDFVAEPVAKRSRVAQQPSLSFRDSRTTPSSSSLTSRSSRCTNSYINALSTDTSFDPSILAATTVALRRPSSTSQLPPAGPPSSRSRPSSSSAAHESKAVVQRRGTPKKVSKPTIDDEVPVPNNDNSDDTPNDAPLNYCSGFNDDQIAAVMAPLEKPLLISAAAGSGKTATITARISHFLHQGMLSHLLFLGK
jgi:hypothetical protein